MRDREKMMHPGLRFLFTKEVPLGTACLCLNAWMVGWLLVKEAIICVSSLSCLAPTRWHRTSVLREA